MVRLDANGMPRYGALQMKSKLMKSGVFAGVVAGVFLLSENASSRCQLVRETVKLKWGPTTFPREGSMVRESHYATSEDRFSSRLFPNSPNQKISAHLRRSCDALKSYGFDLSADCSEVYRHPDQFEWTPPEGGGQFGQAARGNLRPDVISELWQGNLMYARGAMPPHGTKYIVSNPSNGKSVVVSLGLEVGPSSPQRIAGVTSEVHWYLDSDNDTTLRMGRAKDQTLPLGPIDCK